MNECPEGKLAVSLPPVDLSGNADWVQFDAPSLVGASLRFVSGEPDGNRYRVRYFRDADQRLQARVWFGPETEGPPGHAHGGSMAAVLDEVLGLAAWAAGYPVVVGNLNVSFRNLLPLEHVVTVESEIISAEGRKVMVHGRICSGKTVFAEAECLCITIPAQQQSKPEINVG
ncbi:MAG: PaaI family thioesterase [Desulfuromonas sp.]|nr:MAG: PaaI family thioesterase [Desulfuromonas sp.]